MVLLYHGPEARDKAVLEAERVGRPLSDPLGDGGLSIEDSREITLLTTYPGVGDRPPSLVVGPMDKVKSHAASDALLKTIEELASKPMRLILWADDLSGVSPTIQSRCLSVWSPAGPRWHDPLAYKREAASSLRDAILSGDTLKILNSLEEMDKDWLELAEALIRELASSLSDESLPVIAQVWFNLRDVMGGQGGTLVFLDAVLPRLQED